MASTHVIWEGNFQNAVRNEVLKAGDYLSFAFKNFDRSKIEHKSSHDLVSYVDRKTEDMLREGLAKIAPEATMWAEESGDERFGKSDYWILDPLDGTTNFVHGLPHFAISLALVKSHKITAGLVYAPLSGDLFEAWEGLPAQLNGQALQVSQEKELNNSLIATGFPVTHTEQAERMAHWLSQLMRQSRGIRRFGSAALDLAWTAQGRFEGFYELGLSPWDVAAAAYIVERSGGKVSSIQDGKDWLLDGEILATNTHIHEALRSILLP